jgi:hypothetical protein
MLDGPRRQLSRISSRLAQTAGLTSLDLAAEVVAFSYGSIAAAVETGLHEATRDVMAQLRTPAPHALSPAQFAAVAESTFAAFSDGERVRGRFEVKRAFALRSEIVRAVRATTHPPPAPSVITTAGVPKREHFQLFFEVATNGVDPRGAGTSPSLGRLIGRVDQIRGSRNDFAHECADPSEHELVVGRTRDMAGLSQEVAKLHDIIDDLQKLLDVLELACGSLRHSLAGQPLATALRHHR